jgi:predicted CxxxxCH...CXXCH cytochrome family protein
MNTRLRIIQVAGLSALVLLFAACSRTDESFGNEDSCTVCHTSEVNQIPAHRIHLSDLAMSKFPLQAAKHADTIVKTEYIVDGTRRDTIYYATPADTMLDTTVTRQQRRLLAHKYDCATCHQGYHAQGLRINPDYHRNGVRDVVFDGSSLRDSLPAKYLSAGGPVYAGTAQTCDNVACHGAGRALNPATGAGLGGVVWRTTAVSLGDTLNCNGCHNTTSHRPSIARDRCSLCHYSTTMDGKTIRDYTKHINGALDVRR